MKIILSGGGTGGHIYPAVAVAEALKHRFGDNVELLFVGANGKMEMEKIPALGYKIVGLNITGMKRSASVDNIKLIFNAIASILRSRKIIRKFDADVVVGFGGYASAPVLWAAQRMGRHTIIQEQNSYAGVTNRILGKKADRICVAYEGMERFFPAERIIVTGNPLRGNFSADVSHASREEALKYFGLNEDKPTVLVVGGSLGTRTLNDMMKRSVDEIAAQGKMQVIWQTGKIYEDQTGLFMQAHSSTGIWYGAFINRMDLAYAAADVVISRSGASTVSELCMVGKPVVFVPSPNVTDDHQTKNAKALEAKNAAIVISDGKAVEEAMDAAVGLLENRKRREELSRNILALAMPDAANLIVNQIVALVEKKKR